ncbi:hypothetical protein CI789_22935 (plasmid) [Erwinia persicina]|uniref:hypothetical protein n=1 Tax=Erwinia persicina TaxID=55211 RepID=UPI000E4CABC8|nr:hypothetical protein [Erwinia persicina]AXU98060.1 hypothetical protein CI789_22935 [Erwinia persicina]
MTNRKATPDNVQANIMDKSKSTFSGTIKQTAHVMTSSSEVIFFGVLFREEGEWLRVATDDITLAESIAFLQPGDNVRIEVKGMTVQVTSRYHRLVSVDMT